MKNLYTSGYTRLGALFLTLFMLSCEDFIQVDPPRTQIVSATVFTNDATANAAISGLYSKMTDSELLFTSGIQSITLLSGLSSDELINHSNSSVNIQFHTNSITGNSSLSLWSDLYKTIYNANSIVEGLENSKGISTSVKRQLEGEAMFIRAFCHFYLVNLFGDTPVVLTTDYVANNTTSRALHTEVYEQIIKDLKEAQSLLASDYSYSKNEKVRPNKWTATALLSRVYLYTKDWVNAETEASALITNPMFGLSELSNAFTANNPEAIWQLMPVLPGYNTFDGSTFILNANPNFVSLDTAFMEDFEPSDFRKTEWVGNFTSGENTYYFPYKYKVKTDYVVTEYLTVFRLAEQYLIRAEARANQNKVEESLQDINALRSRAGLPNAAASDTNELFQLIEHERKIELFCEWGHRWLDLKRTDRANAVLGIIKPGWQSTDTLYPIPENEIKSNPNLLPQNPGY